MTIKQIFILSFAVFASMQTNAMDRHPSHPIQPNFVNKDTFFNHGNMIVAGPFHNAGFMVNTGTLIVNQMSQPQVFYQPYPPRPHQPQYRAQTYPQQETTMALYAQQQKARMNLMAEEERKKQASQDKSYNELKDLYGVRDFLPKQQNNQITRVMENVSKREGRALAEIIVPQLNKLPEVQEIKPFIEILKEEPEKIRPFLTKNPETKTFFFQTPEDFLQKPFEQSLWSIEEKTHTNLSGSTSEHICSQLQLMQEQNKPFWLSVTSDTL